METGTPENPYKLTATHDVHWAPSRRWMSPGWWVIGTGPNGMRISHPKRPSWLQRYLMRTLLTIGWIDDVHEVTEFHG